MSHEPLKPALNAEEWTEWRKYKAKLAQSEVNPARAALNALQTLARNNDLLPDDSPYKITHRTVGDLRSAADCLEEDGNKQQAISIRAIASMLEASLGPASP